MARADLIVKLVKAGRAGDRDFFKKVLESIIAEERSKQHFVLANQLEIELKGFNNVDSGQESSGVSLTRNENIESLLLSINPTKKLSDLVLDDAIVRQLTAFMGEYNRKDLLRAYNLEPRHKLLFVGPPGNGKTSLAEVIAAELMLPLYVVKYDGIIGSYLGETAGRLKKAIDFLKTQECVVFFDEFDAIGKERGDEHETGEIKRVVSSLLLQIDRLPSHLIVIAATNHHELLDRAVWRRFQLKFQLKKPTQRQITTLLKRIEERLQHKLPMSYSALTKMLSTFSYAEIEEFGLNIQRRYVLSLPNANLKNILSECLAEYNIKTLPK